MPIEVFNDSGEFVQKYVFRCGQCTQDDGASLVFLTSDAVPHDIPIRCVHCRAMIGVFNPSPEHIAAAGRRV